MNHLDLNARVAVVTGGARGIGLAVARRILLSGGSVAIWDKDHAELGRVLPEASRQARGGGRVMAAAADVTSSASVAQAALDTERQLGRIDVLVNNAALVFPEAKFWETPDEHWHAMFDVNMLGIHRCCRELIPRMMRAGYGRVVNMGSAAGKNGNENLSAYSATKAAIINYTKVVAREVAGSGVLVNCVAPSATETEGLATVSAEQRALIASWIPLKRFAQPAEIAALVAWLCTEDCSYTTGATFDAAGGRTYY